MTRTKLVFVESTDHLGRSSEEPAPNSLLVSLGHCIVYDMKESGEG